MSRIISPFRTGVPYPLWLLARLSDEDHRLAASPPAVIGGAVIHAARRSAKLARQQFARAIGMDHQTVLDLEHGEIPLFAFPTTARGRMSTTSA